ncbi:hypothetical protein E1285_04475 [Actinomadura sp. 7K507]|nr:hypothetical protein E1285_04475 [Actinomadura sp. 7K507]
MNVRADREHAPGAVREGTPPVTRPDTARPTPLIRIERGGARPEDLAAIAVVLLLRARRAAAGRGRGQDRRATAAWRSPAFRPPHSWRDGRRAREVRHDTAQGDAAEGPDRQPW